MNPLLLSVSDAAKLTSFASATVKNWAYGRKSAPPGFPNPIKVGRVLRYRFSDLETWVTQIGTCCAPVRCASESDQLEDLPVPRRRRGRPSKLPETNYG